MKLLLSLISILISTSYSVTLHEDIYAYDSIITQVSTDEVLLSRIESPTDGEATTLPSGSTYTYDSTATSGDVAHLAGGFWIRQSAAQIRDEDIDVDFSGTNHLDGLVTQDQVNAALDTAIQANTNEITAVGLDVITLDQAVDNNDDQLEILQQAVNSIESRLNVNTANDMGDVAAIAARDLRITIPDSVGQRITATNGVRYRSTGTEAGDWEVDYEPSLYVPGLLSERSGLVENTGRYGASTWSMSVVKEGRPFVWGRNGVGNMPIGAQTSPQEIAPFVFAPHPTRPHPDYDERDV